MQPRKPVTARDVAEHFGVTVETVNRWVRERRIPHIRISRRVVRFDLVDVEHVLRRSPDRLTVGREVGG